MHKENTDFQTEAERLLRSTEKISWRHNTGFRGEPPIIEVPGHRNFFYGPTLDGHAIWMYRATVPEKDASSGHIIRDFTPGEGTTTRRRKVRILAGHVEGVEKLVDTYTIERFGTLWHFQLRDGTHATAKQLDWLDPTVQISLHATEEDARAAIKEFLADE